MQYVIRTKTGIQERSTTESEQNLTDLLINLCKEFGNYEGFENEKSVYISLEERELNAPGMLRSYSPHDIFLVTYTDELISESVAIEAELRLDRRPVSLFVTIDNNDKIKNCLVDYIGSMDITDKASSLSFPRASF